MKSKLLAAAIIVTTLAAQSAAFADDHGYHGRDPHRGPPPHARHDAHHDSYHGHDYYRGDRGAGPHHDFRRGQRLSAEYRHREYVVDNWRAHHLKAPPRGYHWVQTGPDYVLVAVASGIIAQIVLGN